MKKLLSTLLTLCMVLIILPADMVSAAGSTEIIDLGTYKLQISDVYAIDSEIIGKTTRYCVAVSNTSKIECTEFVSKKYSCQVRPYTDIHFQDGPLSERIVYAQDPSDDEYVDFGEGSSITVENNHEYYFNNGSILVRIFAVDSYSTTLGDLTVSLSFGNGEVTLAPQMEASGFTYYYKTTKTDDSNSKPEFYDWDEFEPEGWAEYNAAINIPVEGNDEIFVQVVKVYNRFLTIYGWGQASVVPSMAHSIIATAGSGGSITPAGSVTVNNGANQTFTIKPNSNFFIEDVMVDGVSHGKITSYTFNNVTADHTISATFRFSDSGSTSSGSDSSNESSTSYTTGVVVTGNLDSTIDVFVLSPSSTGKANEVVDSTTYNQLRRSLESGYTPVAAYEIRASRYSGKLTLSFPVGTQYNGKEFLVKHKTSMGTIESFTGVVTDGNVVIIVSNLSPFMIAIKNGVEIPETGVYSVRRPMEFIFGFLCQLFSYHH